MSCRSRVGILMTAVAAMGVVTAAASAAMPLGYVDASTFGGGYNATDATAALQAAIDSGNSQIFVPNKGTPWIIEPIFLKSNKTILFESGTVVQAKAASFTGTADSLFTGVGNVNVTLSGYGATLRMNQSDYTDPNNYTASESRMGIRLYSVTNFQIEGLKIEDTGGDGIYLGAGSATSFNSNVSIKDVTLNNNYRNGISVISADGLTIDNATVLNTNGTAPKAGIDFEPNYNTQVLKNITVKNSIFASNGGNGIMFDLAKWDSGGTNQSPYNKQPSDVTATIENVTVYANAGDGINLRESLKNVTFKDSI
ncbi:MAG: right-handed parallel beta-helix repeat-containing protein, partial [Phycisphaerales bacterium]|nr:right-handed parallel beta-helix repeat-containing protein [Phycisphaerales bacterium]